MIRSCKSSHPYRIQDHFDAKNILSKYSRYWNTNEEHLSENTWFCQNTCQHQNTLTGPYECRQPCPIVIYRFKVNRLSKILIKRGGTTRFIKLCLTFSYLGCKQRYNIKE